MATLRELKGRIGSVASSEKITGAMKMISSAKMHKAEQSLRRLLPYRQQLQQIMSSLVSADCEFSSPLIESRDIKHISIVVFGSDDGLCGAYNINICKQLISQIKSYQTKYGEDILIDIYPIGSKMAKAVSKLSCATIKIRKADEVDSKTTGNGVKIFVDSLKEKFLDGTTDKIDVLYMNFISVSRQRPLCQQLLPIATDTDSGSAATASNRPYIFEPDSNTIFSTVLPMHLNAMMQDVFTENRASEQAARVMAMQSANDNAKKLLEQLRLEYNKLRQQSITTELLDILGGQVR